VDWKIEIASVVGVLAQENRECGVVCDLRVRKAPFSWDKKENIYLIWMLALR